MAQVLRQTVLDGQECTVYDVCAFKRDIPMAQARHTRLSQPDSAKALGYVTEEDSGQINMAHPYALALSLYQCMAITLPVALIAVFSVSWFAYGGAAGMLLLRRFSTGGCGGPGNGWKPKYWRMV